MAKKSTAPKAPKNGTCRIRMYRHGLGDCFLISLPTDGKKEFHVLIDCGLIAVATNPKETMTRVVKNIAEATGGRLDLVVVTHEHWDHVSGFSTHQAREVFDNELTVERVWYAWTEDAHNKLGQKLRREREAKARAAHRAAKALQGLTGLHTESAARVSSLLTFFGIADAAAEPLAAKAEGTIGKVRQAFDYLAGRNGIEVEYLHPKDAPRRLPRVGGLRIYVLGPPESEALIKRSDPTKTGKEVYELGSGPSLDDAILAAFARLDGDSSDRDPTDRDCPFDPYLRRQPHESETLQKLLEATWNVEDEAYRRIDNDWMNAAEALALALDKHTNNTSLALAFEFVDSGRVMLFAADAQVGNWLSWQDLEWQLDDGNGKTSKVTGPDLLRRTVLYKVGHHGSHNATLRDKGLEQMTSPELIALVPVNKAQAVKNRWNEMPFDKLMTRLVEKTRGRVIQSDRDVSPPAPDDLDRLTPAERKQFKRMLEEDPGRLFYDVHLPM